MYNNPQREELQKSCVYTMPEHSSVSEPYLQNTYTSQDEEQMTQTTKQKNQQEPESEINKTIHKANPDLTLHQNILHYEMQPEAQFLHKSKLEYHNDRCDDKVSESNNLVNAGYNFHKIMKEQSKIDHLPTPNLYNLNSSWDEDKMRQYNKYLQKLRYHKSTKNQQLLKPLPIKQQSHLNSLNCNHQMPCGVPIRLSCHPKDQHLEPYRHLYSHHGTRDANNNNNNYNSNTILKNESKRKRTHIEMPNLNNSRTNSNSIHACYKTIEHAQPDIAQNLSKSRRESIDHQPNLFKADLTHHGKFIVIKTYYMNASIE